MAAAPATGAASATAAPAALQCTELGHDGDNGTAPSYELQEHRPRRTAPAKYRPCRAGLWPRTVHAAPPRPPKSRMPVTPGSGRVGRRMLWPKPRWASATRHATPWRAPLPRGLVAAPRLVEPHSPWRHNTNRLCRSPASRTTPLAALATMRWPHPRRPRSRCLCQLRPGGDAAIEHATPTALKETVRVPPCARAATAAPMHAP
ncbi:hypothetical protein E2562_015466 [Oryza meyeriana var. granulata]|uniref:Uncharacterized protein n=1 Tax=Oryza meyeriana var. granulata TaxID=110450 RepID=A0A6G1BX20_9ORYZ|nr:hypothetical protein E2562_015466 [Oryza meyeriana var. granulata]